MRSEYSDNGSMTREVLSLLYKHKGVSRLSVWVAHSVASLLWILGLVWASSILYIQFSDSVNDQIVHTKEQAMEILESQDNLGALRKCVLVNFERSGISTDDDVRHLSKVCSECSRKTGVLWACGPEVDVAQNSVRQPPPEPYDEIKRKERSIPNRNTYPWGPLEYVYRFIPPPYISNNWYPPQPPLAPHLVQHWYPPQPPLAPRFVQYWPPHMFPPLAYTVNYRYQPHLNPWEIHAP